MLINTKHRARAGRCLRGSALQTHDLSLQKDWEGQSTGEEDKSVKERSLRAITSAGGPQAANYWATYVLAVKFINPFS